MGHIVFAEPGINSFQLLSRLRRDLVRRGHRVSLWCTRRRLRTFWQCQLGDDAQATIAPRNRTESGEHWLARNRPDLLLVHRDRSAQNRTLATAAAKFDCRVLWTGEGLLPHTMQIDEAGIDADASIRRWAANDFRVVDADQALLKASLVHALSNAHPVSLPPTEVTVPKLRHRLADAWGHLTAGELREVPAALTGWSAALPHGPPATPAPATFDQPHVAVLLQAKDDQRLRLDAPHRPSPRSLLEQTLAATRRCLPAASVVAVLPEHGADLIRRSCTRAFGDDVALLTSEHTAAVASAAALVVTVNAPAATTALLAGTPVVHLGDALYGLNGVTVQTTIDRLGEGITHALQTDRSALRRRFLTWLLRYAHVWCSCTAPSHNGVLGLVQAIEHRLANDPKATGRPLPYRPGPAWPLAIR